MEITFKPFKNLAYVLHTLALVVFAQVGKESHFCQDSSLISVLWRAHNGSEPVNDLSNSGIHVRAVYHRYALKNISLVFSVRQHFCRRRCHTLRQQPSVKWTYICSLVLPDRLDMDVPGRPGRALYLL
jgi:hypothetical protein